jgi:hypothetical protein
MKNIGDTQISGEQLVGQEWRPYEFLGGHWKWEGSRDLDERWKVEEWVAHAPQVRRMVKVITTQELLIAPTGNLDFKEF